MSQRVEALLLTLHEKVDRLMATVEEVNALVGEINDATNEVAEKVEAQVAEIARLKDVIANGDGVTPADLDNLIAGLEPIGARLRTIASDPGNPVPVEG